MKALAEALEAVRKTRSRIAKEQILANYLASTDESTVSHAARMLAGRVFPVDDRRSPRAGYTIWRDAAAVAADLDRDIVTESMRATGDAGEAIGLLIEARRSTTANSVSVMDSVALAEQLAATGSPSRKIVLLSGILRKIDGISAKYLVKLLSGGLRVGAQQGIVEGAIARAFEVDIEDVRKALAKTADVGEVALLARRHELDQAQVVVGRPIGFMLATAIQTMATRPSGPDWSYEDKLDGIRAQVHKNGTVVRLFARSGDPIDGMFPEIEEALRAATGTFVLDGEIVAMESDQVIAPFAQLQERLNRKNIGERELRRLPVAYVTFDLLYQLGHGSLLDRPWTERRDRLVHLLSHELSESPLIRLLPSDISTDGDLEVQRREALERGAEGLVLKRRDSVYEAGRRGQSWVKVKEAFATLDVVITAAEEGHGKRRGMLSDYTFAVWRGDELVNIGKAYSGLTDEEIEAITVRLTAMTVSRHGRVRAVRPEIVLEIAFDGINRSARHRSGYALRFPRIVRVRDDKAPGDANRVEDVATLFAHQGASRAKMT